MRPHHKTIIYIHIHTFMTKRTPRQREEEMSQKGEELAKRGSYEFRRRIQRSVSKRKKKFDRKRMVEAIRKCRRRTHPEKRLYKPFSSSKLSVTDAVATKNAFRLSLGKKTGLFGIVSDLVAALHEE